MTAFSLARENEASREPRANGAAHSSGIAAGLTLLLMVLASILVVGPLGKLVGAARRLERGPGLDTDFDLRGNDEVGQLAGALRSMAGAIQVREERINARNRDMRLVLDNVGQGFSRSIVRASWRGALADRRGMVRADRGQAEVLGLPAAVRSERRGQLRARAGGRGRSVLPVDLCLDQLPKMVKKDGRTFELDYRPISRTTERSARQDHRHHHRHHRAPGTRAIRAAPARDDEHLSAADRRSPGLRASSTRRRACWSARSSQPTSIGTCRSSGGRCTRSRGTARCSASRAWRSSATRSRIGSPTRRV